MGQCAKCRIVDNCYRGWKDLNEPYMNCVSFSPIITNADRIRAMTDEELAELLYRGIKNYGRCPISTVCKYCRVKQCVDCWLDWLKQETDNERLH